MNYDLEGRTLAFSKNILSFIRKIPIKGSSNKDFKNKIAICRKEVNETKYWIELLAAASSEHKKQLRIFWKEANELSLIFGKIFYTLNNKN